MSSPRVTDAAASPNLLVISDVHLGADLQEGRYRRLRRLAQLDHELSEFLDHYRASPTDGRPWRLIIGGDLIDFMNVHIRPTAAEREDLRARAEELKEDADVAEGETVRRKLVRVIVRHRDAFAALARFIAAGHEVVIVHGNHDAEFYWPEVRAELIGRLAGLCAEALGVEFSDAAERVQSAVTFTPWFYYEPGLVYVEHGHQYDEFCSFDYLLAPVDDTAGRLVDNTATLATRRVTLNVPGFVGEETRHWTLLDYGRWLWRLGPRRAVGIVALYFVLAAGLLDLWWQTVRGRLAAAKGLHRRNLRAFAERMRLPLETVLAIDGLRQRPVQWYLGKVVRLLFLDGLFIFLTGAALAWFAITSEATGLRGTLLGVAAAATLGLSIARFARRGYGDGGTLQAPRARLIRDLLSVRFVVMGHSHAARVQPLGNEGLFFNTGSWVEGTPMHVLIRRAADDGPHAELLPWTTRA
jgi:UDP-2,3-diacylglucosamine pyrophosphatase LpxH